MFNSIIIAHRNRVLSVRVLLRTLLLASNNVKPDSYEIVVTDLGSDSGSIREFETYKPLMNLKLLRVDYKGPFWKTKALNHCAKHAEGKYLTMIDADSLVQPNFLRSIESFYSKNNYKIKLAHRVRFLTDSITSSLAKKARNLDEETIKRMILKRHNSFSLARERYSGKETRLNQIPQSQRSFAMRNKALGNSHFTMLKESYMAIGGYDEKFIGHGLEDLDFNLRAWKHLNLGTLRPEVQHTIFHVCHSGHSGSVWFQEKLRSKNRCIYQNNKKNNIIVVPMEDDWGEFK